MTDDRPIHISDHALVRYMERVLGMSLDGYREEIRRLVHENRDNEISWGAVWDDDGLVLVIEELGRPVVVTILGPGPQPKRPRQFTSLIRVPGASADD